MTALHQKFFIELDGLCYRYDGSTLEQIPGISGITDETGILISDMGTSGAMTMLVDADARYAELAVRKKLMESGEFNEPISILTHWKKARGGNATQLFFTTLPARAFDQYQNNLSAQDGNIILIPLYAILHQILRKQRSVNPTAVIFQHSRFGDLLIGTNKQIYYANRCVSFDSSEEQISNLWETIRRDIQTTEMENGIKVEELIFINWVDSAPLPVPSGESHYTYTSLPRETISFHESSQEVSFFHAARKASLGDSVSPLLEKAAYAARKYTPAANVLCILLLLLLFGAYTTLQNRSSRIENKIAEDGKAIIAVQKQIPQVSSVIDYKNTLEFIDTLAACRATPSFQSILNDISHSWIPEMQLESMQLDYSSGGIQMEIFGKIATPFNTAYKGYHHFLGTLKNRGYVITENRFDTEIQNSQFFIKLTKAIP